MAGRILFLLFFPCVLLISCAAETSPATVPEGAVPVATPPPVARTDFPVGEVIPQIPVTAHPSETFALYLPEKYTHDQDWPVVFCFDAQGRGEFPVQRYSLLAEMFQMVFVGSHASRNGLQPAQSLQIGDHLIQDLQEKLHLDPARMYAAGFSGGARVAAMLGQRRTDIAGVLACGAGFQPQAGDQFHFVGMVGMEDFNYQEMRQLDLHLDQIGRRHLVEYFVGGHDWAPVNFMAKGLQWMYFRAMQAGTVARSDTATANMLKKFRYQDARLQNGGTPYQRWLLRKKILSYLEGNAETRALREEMEVMRNSPEVTREFARQEQELQREMGMRQQYSADLTSKDIPYWTRVGGMLRKVGRKGRREDAWLNLRVLNFLSLSAYLQAGQLLQANALEQADRMLQIYALVDPPNAEHAYLRAVLRVRQGRNAEALTFLGQAFDLGFEDVARMQADPALAPLRKEAEFQDLLRR